MEFHSFKIPSVKTETSEAIATDFEILVFCTSLRNLGDVRKITPVMNAIPEINSWSVDLEDCDRVLRVVSHGLDEAVVSSSIKKLSFDCWPMID